MVLFSITVTISMWKLAYWLTLISMMTGHTVKLIYIILLTFSKHLVSIITPWLLKWTAISEELFDDFIMNIGHMHNVILESS